MYLTEDKEGGKIKMQADQTPVIWTVVIATIALLVAGIIGGSVINSNLKLTADALDDISVDVDEQAIVNAIMAGIVMPEWTAPEIPEMPDTAKLNEVWDEVYSEEVSFLKSKAKNLSFISCSASFPILNSISEISIFFFLNEGNSQKET